MSANSASLEPPVFGHISRRGMLKASAALATVPVAGLAGAQSSATSTANKSAAAASVATPNSNRIDMTLQVNGRGYPVSVDTRTTVLDALREISV